jgi:hypothetical protein
MVMIVPPMPSVACQSTVFATGTTQTDLCGMIDLERGLAFRVKVAVGLQLVELADDNLVERISISAEPCSIAKFPTS